MDLYGDVSIGLGENQYSIRLAEWYTRQAGHALTTFQLITMGSKSWLGQETLRK